MSELDPTPLALHPWRPATKTALTETAEQGVDLWTVLDERDDVVERARDRVIGAIADGDVGDAHDDPHVELLSYPIARVFASVADTNGGLREPNPGGAVYSETLARGEAARARTRLARIIDGDAAVIDTATVLGDLDLEDAVTIDDETATITVPQWLVLVGSWTDRWKLANRPVADGRVTIPRAELPTVLREAVYQRLAADLPVDVPDATASRLRDHDAIEAIRDAAEAADLRGYATRTIDTVVPEQFPPCMAALLDAIRSGEHLSHESRFAITSFLVSIGMSTDEIVDLYEVNPGFGEEMTRYQTDHIRTGGDGGESYTPPSCATMATRGDCVNRDDRCETISHPLAYYEKALEAMDEPPADGPPPCHDPDCTADSTAETDWTWCDDHGGDDE